jgi:tRNA-Thr(GGU) m(6)t(6)A37 methyltransferase TsaA
MTRPTPSKGGGDAVASVTFAPIGVIRSPHTSGDSTPIQPVYASGVTGYAEIFPEFAGGLSDLEGFSHIHLIYCFHRADKRQLVVKAFLDGRDHGVFATRAPFRPNPIGLSLVRLAGIEGRILTLQDLDLLDIKPHIPDFDCRQDVRCGWYDRIDKQTAMMKGRRGRNDT